jgi:gamma-glutamylcyclotransferase (GGCT)/AIG2-like uncharacterized protein YtfP
MKTVYAAYGSNLNQAQMSLRCPDAVVLSRGELKGYELVFQGHPTSAVATIVPKEDGSVPILLWEISGRDEQALDRYEGYPSFYWKEDIRVESEGKAVTAMAYVMTPGHRHGLPSEGYYEIIAEGYEECGFDAAVLERAVERSRELALQDPDQGVRFW